MSRSKTGKETRRGNKVRFEKKPKSDFFNMQMPYDRDKLIKEYPQRLEAKLKKKSGKIPKNKEILEKENNKPTLKKIKK